MLFTCEANIHLFLFFELSAAAAAGARIEILTIVCMHNLDRYFGLFLAKKLLTEIVTLFLSLMLFTC